MSKLVKTVFGGTDDSAQKAQTKSNAAAQKLIAEQAALAREDVLALQPAQEENRNLGFQSALDVFAQTIPQQLGTFQQGNVGAQQQLLAGLPQVQAALLGQQVDLSALQPKTIGFDAGFAQQQLPQFQSSVDALAAGEEARRLEQEQTDTQSILELLKGTGFKDVNELSAALSGLREPAPAKQSFKLRSQQGKRGA